MSFFNWHRFELEDNDGNTIEPVPKNADLFITGNRSDSRFNWRNELTDPVIFEGDDFNWLYALETNNGIGDATRCGGVAFRIYVTCGGSETLTYQFFINLNESEWDPDNCTVACKVEPVDAYSCIFRFWEDEIDVLDLVSAKYEVPGLIGYLETETCGPYTISGVSQDALPLEETACLTVPGDGWVVLQKYWLTTTPYGAPPPGPGITLDGLSATVWVRERVDNSVSSPPGDGWVDIGGDSWVREPEVYYYRDKKVYYPEPITPNTYVKYWQTFGRVVGGSFQDEILELNIYSFNLDDIPADPYPPEGIVYPNAMTLEDVLLELVDYGCAGSKTLKSNFFRINEDSPFPSTPPYDTVETAFDQILIWQLSDVVRPLVSESATDLKISLKSFLEELQNIFNVGWTIEGSVFRLEHISYFINSNGTDLTATYSQFVERQNGYRYDSIKIPKEEKFKMAFKTTPFFDGSPITYPFQCASNEVKDVQRIAKLSTVDLGYLHKQGDDAQLTGMFLGAVVQAGGFGVYDFYFTRADDANGDPRINGELALYYLLPNYWKWDRPQGEGTINGVLETFVTTFRAKRQVELTVPVSCSFLQLFDPTELVKTGIGWGEIDGYKISLADCAITFDLLHEENP